MATERCLPDDPSRKGWARHGADSMFSPMDTIPASVQAALELSETALADVRFANLDAKTLARTAADVHAVASVVASAQAALDSARCALQERQEVLLEQVQRAIAYARVYAENDEALSQRLDAITLPRAARGARAKDDAALVLSSAPHFAARSRRGKRKVAGCDPTLVADLPGGSMSGDDGEENDRAVGSP